MENNQEKTPVTDAENGGAPTENGGKMFTQEQLNELIGKARKEGRESAMRDIETQLQSARDETSAKLREKYGVTSDEEMDAIFGKGQQYDSIYEENTTYGKQLRDKEAEIALLQSGVSPDRFGDVRAILGMKGLDITPENIQTEMATHAEWTNSPAQTQIKTLGASVPETKEPASDEKSELKTVTKYYGY